MMSRLFLLTSLFISVCAPLWAQSPVVVELFTSQGCSSCPPADRMLHDLTKREDVIPLALHVDYWDYIGWTDEFARPEHAVRQRAYAAEAGRRSIYTPQMIVNGVASVVGAKGMALADAIQAQSRAPSLVTLNVVRSGARVEISAQNTGGAGQMVVSLVSYTPTADVRITRGENAGHRFTYSNIVTDWQRIAEWGGSEDLALSVSAEGPVVVLVQAADHGPILAARQLR